MQPTTKKWIGGLVVGLILGGLVGSYITFIYMANNIISKIDTCEKMDCVRYERVNTSK